MMSVTALTYYWLLVTCSVIQADSDSSHQPGSARQCFAEFGEKGLWIDALPGKGWDNLRNKENHPVFDYKYSKCHTTHDGKYLLPDHMSAIPVLQSNSDTYTDVLDHPSKYSSLTASSINRESSVRSVISGYFSPEYESFKQKIVKQKAETVRVQLRHVGYKLSVHPPLSLNPVLKRKIMEIAASIQRNQTEMATYLSQLLVREYGTHYTHTLYFGAILVKDDLIKMDELQTALHDKGSVSAGAQADFFDEEHPRSKNSGINRSKLEMYRKAIQSTSTVTYGGPTFTTDMNVAKWEAGVESSMVAIDREGEPIHFLINPDTLPEIPPSIVIMVSKYVKNATDKYYSINTHRGCTDFRSPNFNYFANIDDGTCKDTSQNFAFGGVYQTCRITQGDNLCGRLEQKNPLTQGYSCPSGYTAIQLMTGKESYTTTKSRCHTPEQDCGILGLNRCKGEEVCVTQNETSVNEFKTYWCAGSSSKTSNLYYFGGIYTERTPNFLTSTHGCPNQFQSLKFTSKGHVCVSGDDKLERLQSLPFGGFYSCTAENPFAKTNEATSPSCPAISKTCPKGFSQHLALVADDCEIRYCIRPGPKFSDSPTPIQLPPYIDPPDYFPGNDNEKASTSQETVGESNPPEQAIKTLLATVGLGTILILVSVKCCGR